MKLASLFSGGKDSNYSLFLASKKHEIKCLISLIPKNKESFMFQSQGNEYIKFQARCLNIPIIEFETEGEKEEELNDLKKAIKLAMKKFGIEGVVSGAIKSTYQASRIQRICNDLNLYCINPLWQINEENYLKNLMKNKFKIIIISIASFPLVKKYVGKVLDNNFTKKLKKLNYENNLSMIGEGGEFETFVIDSPLFKKSIKITKSDIICDSENSCQLMIKEVKLIEKKERS